MANKMDKCGATCYPNGCVVIFLAQLLMLAGFLMSGAVLLDCEFVIADVGGINEDGPGFDFSEFKKSFDVNGTTLVNDDTNITLGDPNRRGFGFFNHQDENGYCHFETMSQGLQYQFVNETDVVNYSIDYVDWLGPDWDVPRRLSIAAFGLAVIVWFWLLWFTCIAHPKCLRMLLALLLIVVAMPLQYGAFALLGSEFCQDRNCVIGRTSQISVVTGVVFILVGAFMCCSSGYPGRYSRRVSNARSTPPTETKNKDTAHVEEGTEGQFVRPTGYSYEPSPETVQASAPTARPQVY